VNYIFQSAGNGYKIKIIYVRISVLFIYCVIAVFVYKGSRIARKVMAIIMLIYGVWAIFLGIFAFKFPILTILGILFGSYFIYGGISLLSNDKSSSMKIGRL
jgi:ABC-type transport system involved in cytochrome c biogenesis permease subunit